MVTVVGARGSEVCSGGPRRDGGAALAGDAACRCCSSGYPTHPRNQDRTPSLESLPPGPHGRTGTPGTHRYRAGGPPHLAGNSAIYVRVFDLPDAGGMGRNHSGSTIGRASDVGGLPRRNAVEPTVSSGVSPFQVRKTVLQNYISNRTTLLAPLQLERLQDPLNWSTSIFTIVNPNPGDSFASARSSNPTPLSWITSVTSRSSL